MMHSGNEFANHKNVSQRSIYFNGRDTCKHLVNITKEQLPNMACIPAMSWAHKEDLTSTCLIKEYTYYKCLSSATV